ncbi:MAG: hypothetical protein LBI39_02815 [Puniceicoccales bacterium]|nr:hypothetical protein [Puniceicoccales bacterium]
MRPQDLSNCANGMGLGRRIILRRNVSFPGDAMVAFSSARAISLHCHFLPPNER